jgi:hypothetical protein
MMVRIPGALNLDERWNAWEEALLSLMGCMETRELLGGRNFRMLVIPTFHFPCCLTIEDRDTTAELSCVILRDRDIVNAAFNRIWNVRHRLPHSPAGLSAPVWADIVELTPQQLADFHQLCTDLNPAGLENCDEAVRDGIGLQLRCQGPNGDHTIRMRSPSAKTNPDQHRWATALIDLASESFTDSFVRDYLDDVRGYLDR